MKQAMMFILALFLLAAAVDAQGMTCPNKCYRSKSIPFDECHKNGGPVMGCSLVRCKFAPARRAAGWACVPNDGSPIIPTLTPKPPGRCGANRCYRARSGAWHECYNMKGLKSGCDLRRCDINGRRKEQGWICVEV